MIKEALASIRAVDKQNDANNIAVSIKYSEDRILTILKEVSYLQTRIAEGLAIDLDNKDAVSKYLGYNTQSTPNTPLYLNTSGRVGL